MENQLIDLKGKTILVTGSSSGIGEEVAVQISRYGGNVIITGRNEDRLNSTYSRLIGESHKLILADLTNDLDLNTLVEQLSSLDGIVHCVGITSHILARFTKDRHIDEIINTNFKIPVLLTSKLLQLKKIKNNASLIFLSSIASKLPYIGGTLYGASKSAIEGYSKSLALELASKGIRSNCIVPGMVDTNMYSQTKKVASEETIKNIEALHPLGIGNPIDVAGPVCFLLSDQAKWITGINLPLGIVI
jgi:NAD(P)-dependent dehydrogenase (short-subunit alcohol dehydrogenase family)